MPGMSRRRSHPGRLATPLAVSLGVSALVTFMTAVVLIGSAPGLAIVWDEGEYLGRALRIAEWLHLLFAAPAGTEPASVFSAETIQKYWQFVTWSEGHPAFGAIPMALTSTVFGGVVHPLQAARLGPIVVFCVASGAVAFRMRQTYGVVAASVAAAALLTFPRLFAEAHYATLDGQLTAWWLTAWAADAGARRHWQDEAQTSALVGVLAGLTCAIKFSGWAIWLPLVVARLIVPDRRRRAAGLLVAIPAGLLTYYAVNPPLWHAFVATALTHVRLNAQRTLDIPTMFLGTRYDLAHSLPWYNTIVWLAVVTPVHLLVLSAAGAWSGIRRFDRHVVSLVLHGAALMIVRALPGTPPHDGVRLFLPAIGFLCVLAGVGAHGLMRFAESRPPGQRLALAAALAIAVGGGAVNLSRYYPQPLSHYNLLVGGLRGAAALGMEPTYWWDALDRRALEWLNTHTGSNEAVAFSTPSNTNVLRHWGWLRPDVVHRSGTFRWYVLQNRSGMLSDADRYLVEHVVPTFAQYAGSRDAADTPWDLRVPLLLVYEREQYLAARAATGMVDATRPTGDVLARRSADGAATAEPRRGPSP